MDWTKLDWAALDRLRDGFLSGTAAHGPYWQSLNDLANYDLTYGERIGWKWDAVLSELKRRGWSPPAKSVLLDWGCGSGIAGRRVLRAFGAEHFSALRVWDHSPLAREFSTMTAHTEFPSLDVAPLTQAEVDEGKCHHLSDTLPVTLVVSHVLNELSTKSRAELLSQARRAGAIVWVEPGTHAVSRELIALREQLRADFRLVAPCPHQRACGMLAADNARHWCHAFASPPPSLYADSDWVKFGQRAGIDLRSLPYSFLVLERATQPSSAPSLPEGTARIIGDPRHYKGFAKLYSCDETGVSELTLQKRDDPKLFKQLERNPGIPLFQWQREKDRIHNVRRLIEDPPP